MLVCAYKIITSHMFSPKYLLGYGVTLGKGGRRGRLWVGATPLPLGTHNSRWEGRAGPISVLVLPRSCWPAGHRGGSLRCREWGSPSATFSCFSSGAWQATQSAFSLPVCIIDIIPALPLRIFVRIKQVILLKCFEPCLKMSTFITSLF